MKTYKFKYAKLVRDKIPEIIAKAGGKISQKTLAEKAYIYELRNKLIEECAELSLVTKKEEMIDELIDIQEIIDNLSAALHLSSRDIKKAQQQKNKKNGSFKRKIYINHIQVKADYNWLEYHLKNKEKYPLIK